MTKFIRKMARRENRRRKALGLKRLKLKHMKLPAVERQWRCT